jgi:Domain of unknown function (DUF6487)
VVPVLSPGIDESFAVMVPTVDASDCPRCGQPMELGSIEGTYLAWVRERRTRGNALRAMFGGLGVSDRLGKGFWPSVLGAARCRTCGVGYFEG